MPPIHKWGSLYVNGLILCVDLWGRRGFVTRFVDCWHTSLFCHGLQLTDLWGNFPVTCNKLRVHTRMGNEMKGSRVTKSPSKDRTREAVFFFYGLYLKKNSQLGCNQKIIVGGEKKSQFWGNRLERRADVERATVTVRRWPGKHVDQAIGRLNVTHPRPHVFKSRL